MTELDPFEYIAGFHLFKINFFNFEGNDKISSLPYDLLLSFSPFSPQVDLPKHSIPLNPVVLFFLAPILVNLTHSGREHTVRFYSTVHVQYAATYLFSVIFE